MNIFPECLKRPLREHPITRRPYLAAGRLVARFHIWLHERLIGRYFTSAHFDRLFARRSDPWRYAGDRVSEHRRALILATLSHRRYSRLLEVGSAEGWVTAGLALRARVVFGVDISEVALHRAKARSADAANVHFAVLDMLDKGINGRFDAIVCAGVLVYLPRPAQEPVRDYIVDLLAPGGDLLLEHTSELSPGETSGRAIHAIYARHRSLERISNVDQDGYAVTLFRRTVL